MSYTPEALIQELSNRGAHIGYSRSRRHPSVVPYLFGMKNRLDIIDLADSIKVMGEARAFLDSVRASGKQVLVVGSKPEARDHVRRIADRVGMPFVERRWIGGMLTNFTEMSKRIQSLTTLKEQQATNTLVYRTKKERLVLERKIAKLELNFGGIQSLQGMPGAIIVVDPRTEHNAVKEARIKGIPVIAIANTDCNIDIIDYPIVLNDASLATIQFVLEYLLA